MKTNSVDTDYVDSDGSGSFNAGDQLFNGEWQDSGEEIGVLEELEIKFLMSIHLTTMSRAYCPEHI